MKISYKSFLINGEVSNHTRLELFAKNKYKVYPLFAKYSFVELDWYTVYDLTDFSFKKYKIANDKLFKEGEMKKGRWVNTLGEELFLLKGKETLLDLEGVNFICQTGNVTKVIYETVSIKPHGIEKYIDNDLLKYLPISTFKSTGRIDNDYPIVGLRKHIEPIKHISFKITEISY